MNFSLSTFSDDADFAGVTFCGSADFIESVFSKEANFRVATFNKRVSFAWSNFNGRVDFFKSTFKSLAGFSETTFYKNCTFLSQFQNVNFLYTNFKGPTFFQPGTEFIGGTFASCMVHYRLEFDKVDLRGLKFLGFPVESARFIACKWPRSNGRNVIYDARRIEGKGYFELSNLDDNIAMEPHEIAPDPSHLEDLFRRLKKIAQDERDDLLASDFHYAEKEMQREVLRTAEEGFGLSPLVANLKALPGQVKQALQCTCGEGPHLVNLQYWNNLFLFVVVSIYRTSSGYGEIPLRAFCWLMTLIGLPLLFSDYPLYYIPLAKVGLDPEITVWQGVFITFWQILITLQAGLFAFALRNKFKR